MAILFINVDEGSRIRSYSLRERLVIDFHWLEDVGAALLMSSRVLVFKGHFFTQKLLWHRVEGYGTVGIPYID